MQLLTYRGEGWGRVSKKRSFSKICHTYPTLLKLDIVILYQKKIQKIHKARDTPLEFCWHHHFFTKNQQFLVYQEIQVFVAFWCINSRLFNFLGVSKGCFSKYSETFDDISKSGYYYSLAKKNGILK